MAKKRTVRHKTAAKQASGVEGSSGKVLRALLAFSPEQPRHSAESLAAHVGAPLSSTYRYIGILRSAGLLDEDGRGSFILTPRVLGLARATRTGSDLLSIARPHMQRLSHEAGETVILLRLSGDRAVCVERVESSSRIRLTFELGTAMPLHRGAGPKLLLAHLPDNEIRQILKDITGGDAADQRKALIDDLGRIRSKAWSESRAEITQDVYAVAAGIFGSDGLIAALSIAAPAFRTTKTREAALRNQIRQTALAISEAFAQAAAGY